MARFPHVGVLVTPDEVLGLSQQCAGVTVPRRPGQRFLRRSRLCTDIDLRTLTELLRELEEFEV